MMLREREHRHADVREDEVFCQEVEQFKELFGPISRIRRQIVVGVMRLAYAAKQYRDNT